MTKTHGAPATAAPAVVDSTVRIDFVNDVRSPHASALAVLMRDEIPLAILDVVVVEGIDDVLIASWCIDHGAQLLHRDRDFDAMVSVLGLEVIGLG